MFSLIGMEKFLSAYEAIRVVARAENGEEILLAVAALHPDVLITEANLPLISGLALIRAIVARALPTKVIVLTSSDALNDAMELLEAGAMGYVLKSDSSTEIIDAIMGVMAGRVVLSRQFLALAAKSQESSTATWPFPHLTRRERDVFTRLVNGLSNGEIAAALSLGIKTVETHRTNLYRKLGVHTVSELILLSVHRGLIGREDL